MLLSITGCVLPNFRSHEVFTSTVDRMFIFNQLLIEEMLVSSSQKPRDRRSLILMNDEENIPSYVV
jgi:hypothetical protein